jgi:hypothetical protein
MGRERGWSYKRVDRLEVEGDKESGGGGSYIPSSQKERRSEC